MGWKVAFALLLALTSGRAAATESHSLFESYAAELAQLPLTSRYFEEGRFDLAQRYVEDYLKKNPLDIHALMTFARIHDARGQWSEAESVLRSCARLNPSSVVLRRLSRALIQQSKFSEASAIGGDTRVDQGSLRLDQEVQLTLKNLYKNVNAQTALSTLAELKRDWLPLKSQALYWVIRAAALRHLGRMKESLSALQIALSTDPDDSDVRFEAAFYWEKRGRLDRAAEHLGYLTAIDPNNAIATHRFARVQMLRNRADLAARSLRIRQYLFPNEKWVKEAREKMAQVLLTSERAPASTCLVHVVRPGESYGGLAHHYFGDARKWVEIHQMNDSIRDPRRIPTGAKVRVCRR